MIDLTCSFLVVTSGKPCGKIEAHLLAEQAQRAGAGAVALFVRRGCEAWRADRDIGAKVRFSPMMLPYDRPSPGQGQGGASA